MHYITSNPIFAEATRSHGYTNKVRLRGLNNISMNCLRSHHAQLL